MGYSHGIQIFHGIPANVIAKTAMDAQQIVSDFTARTGHKIHDWAGIPEGHVVKGHPWGRHWDDHVGEAWLTEKGINLNGDSLNEPDLSCENLRLDLDTINLETAEDYELPPVQPGNTRYRLMYVKTRREPYDTVVCAILLRFVHHAAGFAEIPRSDGSWVVEWKHGAQAWTPDLIKASDPNMSPRRIVHRLFDQVTDDDFPVIGQDLSFLRGTPPTIGHSDTGKS